MRTSPAGQRCCASTAARSAVRLQALASVSPNCILLVQPFDGEDVMARYGVAFA